MDPSLPPSHLRSLLPTPATPWMISDNLFQRLERVDNQYRKCEILTSDPEWQFIQQYFSFQKPANKCIGKAYCIHNGAHLGTFESNLTVIESQAENDFFTPKWRKEDPNPLREKVIDRWKELVAPYSLCTRSNQQVHLNRTKIIPLWHGTKEAVCKSVCSTGFTTFGKHAMLNGIKDENSDYGFFGSGLYFTTSAKYAASVYSDGNLLLAWVSMREPYPVIADRLCIWPDKPLDMELLGRGLSAYQNYNAHYIPVISNDPTNPDCDIYYPCTGTQQPTYDEIVVFSPSQTLLRFWIQLEPELFITPTVTTIDHLINQIVDLLKKEVIQENSELFVLLKQKLTPLFTLKHSDPLTGEDLNFYNHIVKLLDSTNKIKKVVFEQLIFGEQEAQQAREILHFVTQATQQLLLPLGQDIQLSNGKSESQQAISLKAVELDPNSAFAHLNLGRTLPKGGSIQLLNGSLMTEQDLYLKAIDLDPNVASAYYNLGNDIFFRRIYPASQWLFDDAARPLSQGH